MRPLHGIVRIGLTALAIACLAVCQAMTSAAQEDGFKTYQLKIHCGNSYVPTKIFTQAATTGGTVGRPLMGTKVLCVGNCSGMSGAVPLRTVLEGVPAGVSAGLRAQIDKHQADAAAGNGTRLTCLGKDKPQCPEPAPWFGSPPGSCKDVQRTRIYSEPVADSLVTVHICSATLFLKPVGEVEEYVRKLRNWLGDRIGTSLCCDKMPESTVGTCNHYADIDCDGIPNGDDMTPDGMPNINLFTTADGAEVDPFPPGLNADDTEFFPPADKCDCKWQLVKGTLSCSTSRNRNHVYQARWKCPTTGNERFTRKEAPPSAPCQNPRRTSSLIPEMLRSTTGSMALFEFLP